MKKLCALVLATVMLFSVSMPVFASVVASPIAKPSVDAEGDKSPTTGDVNLLYVGLAGTTFIATAVVAAKKSRKEA